MNYLKKMMLIVIAIITFNTNAQDYLMSLGSYSSDKIEKKISEYTKVPEIDNRTFKYNYRGGEVIVVFNGREHIEYFKNKKYFIKSSLLWTSKRECYMTIKDFNLPNFPFKVGSKLKMKITKKRGKTVFYESTLGGRTWKGKMVEINRDNTMLAAK